MDIDETPSTEDYVSYICLNNTSHKKTILYSSNSSYDASLSDSPIRAGKYIPQVYAETSQRRKQNTQRHQTMFILPTLELMGNKYNSNP